MWRQMGVWTKMEGGSRPLGSRAAAINRGRAQTPGKHFKGAGQSPEYRGRNVVLTRDGDGDPLKGGYQRGRVRLAKVFYA